MKGRKRDVYSLGERGEGGKTIRNETRAMRERGESEGQEGVMMETLREELSAREVEMVYGEMCKTGRGWKGEIEGEPRQIKARPALRSKGEPGNRRRRGERHDRG